MLDIKKGRNGHVWIYQKIICGNFQFYLWSVPGNKKKKNNGYFLEIDEAETVEVKPTGSNGARTGTSVGKPEVIAKPETTAPEESVKSAKKTDKVSVAPAQPAVATSSSFALNYLLTTTNSNERRYPGANMSFYLELAREIKTR